MYNQNSSHINDLLSLGIIKEAAIIKYADRVRDQEDIKVLKCQDSGVIFLNTSEQISEEYYKDKEGVTYWSGSSRKEALKKTYSDDNRRKKSFLSLINNKSWLDIGTGLGGILDLLAPFAKKVAAVEPQREIRMAIENAGYKVYSQIKQIPKEDKFDIITLFHVFEHLHTPLDDLKDLAKILKPNGKIIIEIPHASDFLLQHLDLASFKAATLWSEHLILHTRRSLELFLKAAGFHNINISGFQRYPLANHLHWLSKDKPGGHEKWSFLNDDNLHTAYCNLLSKLDMTDTLIAIAEKSLTH